LRQCCEKVFLTDQPQYCDDFDLGSLVVQGLGPGVVGAAGAASREAVRMAQIFGSKSQTDSLHDGVLETFDVCQRVLRRRLQQGQRNAFDE
jgi:hypothetical protein